ncbi:MAG: hypothetical protein JO235_07160 [Chroococcidiopsidaceae cyanobacterium CP_BM_RX_35]|nr:hypothetical protein [Chroococcidiopsidaceae cyanobacterium CP_BM_RX_35]
MSLAQNLADLVFSTCDLQEKSEISVNHSTRPLVELGFAEKCGSGHHPFAFHHEATDELLPQSPCWARWLSAGFGLTIQDLGEQKFLPYPLIEPNQWHFLSYVKHYVIADGLLPRN